MVCNSTKVQAAVSAILAGYNQRMLLSAEAETLAWANSSSAQPAATTFPVPPVMPFAQPLEVASADQNGTRRSTRKRKIKSFSDGEYDEQDDDDEADMVPFTPVDYTQNPIKAKKKPCEGQEPEGGCQLPDPGVSAELLAVAGPALLLNDAPPVTAQESLERSSCSVGAEGPSAAVSLVAQELLLAQNGTG